MVAQAITPATPGVLYLLTSPSGKQYVGLTTQGFSKRWTAHQSEARAGKLSPLCIAIRKHGAAQFQTRIIARSTWRRLNLMEEWAIRAFSTIAPLGYNLRPGGRQSQMTPEIGQKISRAKRGKKRPAEMVARIAEKLRGRKQDPEVIERRRQTLIRIGHCPPPSAHAAARVACLGRSWPEERRAKLRAAWEARREWRRERLRDSWVARRARYGPRGRP